MDNFKNLVSVKFTYRFYKGKSRGQATVNIEYIWRLYNNKLVTFIIRKSSPALCSSVTIHDNIKKMKRIILLVLATLIISTSYAQSNDIGKIKANYDERIELMSIICHLAGFQEYNMNIGGDYITDIDNYFADVRNHPAVEMMDSLRRVYGISFDSPMAFAVNLEKNGNGFVLINDSVAPEKRWKGVDLKKATATISDFYNKSNFANFFELHKPFYEKICSIFDANVISKFNQSWYEQFYGVPPTDSFEVILGFTNGGGNYGPSRQLAGKPRDVYAIIGYALDDNGEPYYSSEPEMYLNTLVHEFNHSFVNPLADNPAFVQKMQLAGDAMLSYSRKVMRKNAYSTWQNLVNESIVRAAVIIYLMDNEFPQDKIRQSVIDEMSVGFYWMPDLVKCLQYYAQHRDKYSSIDLYYDEISDFFNNYANSNSEKIDAIFNQE